MGVNRMAGYTEVTGGCDCDGTASLKGTLSVGYAIPRTYVEVQDEEALTIPTGLLTVTVTHTKELHDCWLINVSEYRRSNELYIYIKSVNKDTAELDILNTGSPTTLSNWKTLWLCAAR